MTTRRAVMKAAGEYVDFAKWLNEAKQGINVDEDDPDLAEIAQMVKQAEKRFHKKLDEFLTHV